MIKVTEKYYIKPDDIHYTVVEQKVNKTDEITYLNIGYYRTFTQAVTACMKLVQADELGKVDMNLSEALKVLDRINKEFNDIVDVIRKTEEI